MRRFCRVKYGVSRAVSLVLQGAATQPTALLLVGPRLWWLSGMVGMAGRRFLLRVCLPRLSPAGAGPSRGRATLQNHLLPLPHFYHISTSATH